MKTQSLHIKNMCCPRCEMVVRRSLHELGIKLFDIELGKAVVERLDNKKLIQVQNKLTEMGFALLDDPDSKMVEKIKIFCREYLHKLEKEVLITRLSDYLAANIGKNYTYLSKLFSQQEGITIENYFLQLKIDRVKQLLHEGEMSLSEIAVRLHYSSVHYLSSQFKKIHGSTVSDYLKERKLA